MAQKPAALQPYDSSVPHVIPTDPSPSWLKTFDEGLHMFVPGYAWIEKRDPIYTFTYSLAPRRNIAGLWLTRLIVYGGIAAAIWAGYRLYRG
jgi:hypothetical protein